MSSYVRILLKEFYSQLKIEIMECYEAVDIDDGLLEKIISVPEEYHDVED